MNKKFCEFCNVYVQKSSVWKHNKSDKHKSNLRYEQIDKYNDKIEIPEWLFKGKRVSGFVNPFHLKKPLSDQCKVILIHHNPVDLNSVVKVVGKYNQYISQVHIKRYR